MISLTEIRHEIKGVPILDGVSLFVEAGDRIWICGSAGSGKTILFKILHGLSSFKSGFYRFDGRYVRTRKDRYRIRHAIGAVYEDLRLVASESVLENLRLSTLNYPQAQASVESAIERLSIRFDLTEILEKPVQTLSLAQKRLVATLRALIRPAKVLLIDEAFSGFDHATADLLWDEFVRASACGRVVIFFSSSRPPQAWRCHDVYTFQKGQFERHREDAEVAI